MNDSITIKQVVEILKQDGILTEVSCPDEMLDHPFDYLSYSSSDVKENTFFICKGAAFKEEYLLEMCIRDRYMVLKKTLLMCRDTEWVIF